MAEYNQLEQQLKKTLTELEKKDRQLAIKQQEVIIIHNENTTNSHTE